MASPTSNTRSSTSTTINTTSSFLHDPLPSYLPTFHPPSINTTTTPTRSSNSNSKKKRPRASRRPPTTVLTTDTSNFRAMVQEFTGLPSPSFPSSLMHHHHLITPTPPPPSVLDHAIATRRYQFLSSSPPPNMTMTNIAAHSSSTSNLNVEDNIAPLQLGDLGSFANVAEFQTDKRY